MELRWQFWLNSPFFLAPFGYPVILPSPCGVPYKMLPLLQTSLTFHSLRTCSPGTGGCPFPHGCSPFPPPVASNLPSHQCPPPCDPKAHPLHGQGATGRQQHASCSAALPATRTAGSACGMGTAVMSKPGQAPPAMDGLASSPASLGSTGIAFIFCQHNHFPSATLRLQKCYG